MCTGGSAGIHNTGNTQQTTCNKVHTSIFYLEKKKTLFWNMFKILVESKLFVEKFGVREKRGQMGGETTGHVCSLLPHTRHHTSFMCLSFYHAPSVFLYLVSWPSIQYWPDPLITWSPPLFLPPNTANQDKHWNLERKALGWSKSTKKPQHCQFCAVLYAGKKYFTQYSTLLIISMYQQKQQVSNGKPGGGMLPFAFLCGNKQS